MEQLEIPARPWHSISMDWTNLPTIKDDNGKKFNQVLTVTDRASKQVKLIPCWWEETAPQVAEVFLQHVVRERGLPASIISDRDVKFTSRFWQALCELMEIKTRMTSPFHPQANGAAERTNQTMKQVLRTIVLAKLQQPSAAASANPPQTPNWLRLLTLVEIAINNAPIADTELSPYYLNLGYHPQFFFDVPNFDEERLPGQENLTIKDWIKQLRSDWSFVFRALYHERARAEEFGNRKRANYQFFVGQDILINQRNHHRNQLGPVGPLAPKAVGPYKIKKQITQNTFEIDIPPAVRKKMRPVFHSSELIPFETRELDPVGALPPREDADNPDLLPDEEAELERALRVPGDSTTGGQAAVQVDQSFGQAPADQPAGLVDQQFAPGGPPAWDLNTVLADDPFQIYYFQTIHVVDLPPAPTTSFKRVRLDPEVTVLQLPPPPAEEWILTAVGERCMGLVLSLDCIPLETKLASIPVWESSAHIACSRLCRVANDPHPEFDSTEEVLLCPTVFSAICQNFEVYPEIELFASAEQHQLARYCTVDPTDAQAEGYNAFNFLWTPWVALYLNHPWSLLAQVVDKILVDGTQGLLVAPHWPETQWHKQLMALDLHHQLWNQPLFLAADGRLRRAPCWATIFVHLPGSKA